MQSRRFLAWAAGTVAVLIVAVVALTVSVDPYYVFGSPLVPGWNVRKPAAYNQAAAAKTYQLERSAPRTLLLGNSRMEVGFDPDSPAWPASMRPVFNAGLSGRGLDMAAKLLDDALATPGLRHVLVGLDLPDFLTARSEVYPPGPVDAGPDADRMRPDVGPSPGWTRLRARAGDVLDATLTLGATVDSLRTVLAQHRQGTVTLTPAGFNPLDDYREYAGRQGFRPLFDNKIQQYAARFALYPKMDFAVPYRTDSFAALREIVRTSLAHDLDLVLVVYPYHATFQDLLRVNGLWKTGEAWRRALAQSVAALDPAGRVRIVDFTGYNRYTTERVPDAGDRRTVLQWYWEPGHFQPALGDLAIRRLYGEGVTDFGRDLTPATVGGLNAALADEAAQHPLNRPGSLTPSSTGVPAPPAP